MNQSRTSYLNGQFLPLREATVSVMDRGFLFGDGVYEVIPIYYGKLFRLEQHLTRLSKSLAAVRLTLDFSFEKFQPIFETLIQKNDSFDNAYIYLQITRGTAWIRDHAFPAEATPTVFATYFPVMSASADSETYAGIKAITEEDTRWQHCSVKAITLLPNVLSKEQARLKDAQEAILIRDGYALEGTSSNLFVVSDGLITPPADDHILGGITRELVLELAQKNSIPYEEKSIPEKRLWEVSEIWVTSSTKEIQPVVALNGKPIGSGKPGPLWKKMNNLYQEFKKCLNLSL